ncbi:hypothetical protein ACLOJK_028883 [Asimina triloba]
MAADINQSKSRPMRIRHLYIHVMRGGFRSGEMSAGGKTITTEREKDRAQRRRSRREEGEGEGERVQKRAGIPFRGSEPEREPEATTGQRQTLSPCGAEREERGRGRRDGE